MSSLSGKKIVLVNPPVLAVLEPWYDAPLFPRTALAVLAGYLREESDVEIHCIDAKLERKSFNEVLHLIGEINPDYIGLTAFTNEIKPAAYMAGLVKRDFPQIITICGGAHLTAIPENTMIEFPSFDIGVVGEGELTLLDLIQVLNDGSDLDKVNGIVYRKGEEIVMTKARGRVLDLNQLPMPAWDMMPLGEEYYIQSERGCPFACIFCMNHNGKVARKINVQNTIDEIEWLIQYGAKRISFGDELFSVDMPRAEAIIDAIIENNIGQRVSWDIQTHVAYVNDNLFRKMKLANIAKCEMGVESGDEETLKRMGKATTKEMIVHAFDMARNNQVTTGSFFILGQPNETYKSMWETIKLAIAINPKEPIFATMVPYPGTEVAKMAANGEKGLKLVSTDWDEYRKQLNGSLELTNISRNMLEWFQILGFVIVFIANFRFIELFKFFWSYRGGAIILFKKALFGKKTTDTYMHKPNDYDKIINSPGKVIFDDIIHSREGWKKYQNDEIGRTKKNAPDLLKEQRPI